MTKALGPLYDVHFKRRRQNKTNYAKRLAFLKSGTTRLVVRKSNKFFYAQFVDYSEKGDKIISSASSKELQPYGFLGKCNTPSAYLTGFLAAKKALVKGVKNFNLDIGLHAATKGSIVFAALKGAVDAGLQTSFDKEKLPTQDRISGKHLSEATQKQFNDAKTKLSELK